MHCMKHGFLTSAWHVLLSLLQYQVEVKSKCVLDGIINSCEREGSMSLQEAVLFFGQHF